MENKLTNYVTCFKNNNKFLAFYTGRLNIRLIIEKCEMTPLV